MIPNPFRALVKRESKALVRGGSTALVKQAAKAGYQVEADVITVGIADIISNTAPTIPARVAKTVGLSPPNPNRLKVLSAKAAAVIGGGMTVTGMTDLIWDFWHESSIAPDERQKLDTWLNSKGIRVGDPLSSLSPEQIAELTEFIAKARGGSVTSQEVADFVNALTHKGLKSKVDGHHKGRKMRASPYASTSGAAPVLGLGGGGGSASGNGVSCRPKADAIEFLMRYYGTNKEGLYAKLVAISLLMRLTPADLRSYAARSSVTSGETLLNELDGASQQGEGDDDEDDDELGSDE
jgi:hypothetical protein